MHYGKNGLTPGGRQRGGSKNPDLQVHLPAVQVVALASEWRWEVNVTFLDLLSCLYNEDDKNSTYIWQF